MEHNSYTRVPWLIQERRIILSAARALLPRMTTCWHIYMYLYIHIYVYIYIDNILLRVEVCVLSVDCCLRWRHAGTYMYVYIYTSIYIHGVYIYIYMYMYVCMYVCVHTCQRAPKITMWWSIFLCTCKYIFRYKCILYIHYKYIYISICI